MNTLRNGILLLIFFLAFISFNGAHAKKFREYSEILNSTMGNDDLLIISDEGNNETKKLTILEADKRWTSSPSLQDAYDNDSSAPVVIDIDSTLKGITIRDNSTPIAESLLEVTDDNESASYFRVTDDGTFVSALRSVNDTDDGIDFPGASQMALDIGGSAILSLAASTATFSQQVAVPSGSAATPSLVGGDADSGIYFSGDNSIDFSFGGTRKVDFSTSRIEFSIPLRVANGSTSATSYAFAGMDDGGLYRDSGTDSLRMAMNGVRVQTWEDDYVSFEKPVVPPSMTTTARDALTPSAGWIIYNTTLNKHQGYDGTSWNSFY